MQGKWEHVHVDGGTMLLKDTRNFKTYTAKCVGQRSPVPGMEEERFLVYARTQCGDEHYKCVWLKDRGENALEMQIGEFGRAGYFSATLFCRLGASLDFLGMHSQKEWQQRCFMATGFILSPSFLPPSHVWE